jgi:hypothetical protein
LTGSHLLDVVLAADNNPWKTPADTDIASQHYNMYCVNRAPAAETISPASTWQQYESYKTRAGWHSNAL